MTDEDALRDRVAELEAALADLLKSGQDYAADAVRCFKDKDGATPSGAEAHARRACRLRAWVVLNKTQGELT